MPDQVEHYRRVSHDPKPPAGKKGERRPLHPPGSYWEYNDVRINQLSLALLHLFKRPLPQVFLESVLQPIGGGRDFRWEGYDDSWVEIDGRRIQLQTTGAGQELLTFTGATSGTFTSDISNPAAGGTFTYTPTGSTAVLDLQYDTPAAVANDFSNLTLTFADGDSGTFSGNQHFEGADHQTTGNFSLP